jgi:hypothetical protein
MTVLGQQRSSRPPKRRFWSALMNGHRKTAPVGPVRAKCGLRREADDRLRAEAARYQNRKNAKRRDMSFIRSPYLRARPKQKVTRRPLRAPFAG